jgi:hypothetical protein
VFEDLDSLIQRNNKSKEGKKLHNQISESDQVNNNIENLNNNSEQKNEVILTKNNKSRKRKKRKGEWM